MTNRPRPVVLAAAIALSTSPPYTRKKAGRRQRPPWTDDGGTHLRLADEGLDLRAAAGAAVALAEVVERVRLKYLARAERDANVALRRRFGLDE